MERVKRAVTNYQVGHDRAWARQDGRFLGCESPARLKSRTLPVAAYIDRRRDMVPLIIVLVVVLVLVVFLVGIYNGLVTKRNRVDEANSQIQVQLKRRHDLIPNLVNAVKGYMDFEKGVLVQVTQARGNAISAGSQGMAAQAQAENVLTGALKSLFAVVEAYPDLKANQNVMSLQEQLTTTENQISFARQHYNATVLEFNNSLQVFPNVLIAGPMGFTKREFFEAEPEAAEVPVVNLG
jgi:LemA protein